MKQNIDYIVLDRIRFRL